jgi:predicted acylesterase/phospholipase RssA
VTDPESDRRAVVPEAPRDEALDLQRLESAVIRADFERPGTIPPHEVHRLRYLLSLARLEAFEPGAAIAGRRTGRGDVDVTEAVAPFRRRVLEELSGPLRLETDPAQRLHHALPVLHRLAADVPATRERALAAAARAGTVSPEELEAEIGRRVLVSVAGGGGGAGYVYIGAYQALEAAGIVPGLVIGSSIGAVLGAFRARAVDAPWERYIELARGLDRRELFTPVSLIRRFGLPGLLALRLRKSLGEALCHEDGTPLRISELEIPFQAVVAGVRSRSFDRLPTRFKRDAPSTAAAPKARFSIPRLAPAIATRMWQVAAFFDPRMVKAVVLGADDGTAELNAIDAAGFSASIPGVLHYEPSREDERSAAVLERLFAEQEVAALVDGGVASNVPADHAWSQVRAGRIGSRNVFLLAFDCFHPQWEPTHLWLQPITQAVQLQMQRNAPFADWIIRFEPTLSPVNLVPPPERLDEAIGWGRDAIARELPLIRRFLEPVSWE